MSLFKTTLFLITYLAVTAHSLPVDIIGIDPPTGINQVRPEDTTGTQVGNLWKDHVHLSISREIQEQTPDGSEFLWFCVYRILIFPI
jgi:hypothetical protein